MAFISLDSADLTQDKAVTTDLLLQIKDNFDALNGSIGSISSAEIPNGSFEVDSDANGTPDNWTLSTYAGGTVARDGTVTGHGEASLKMVHPGGAGNGGGYAVSDYVACSSVAPVLVQLVHWSTAAGMKNQVIFYWYDLDRVACSTASTVVYDSVTNPTSATLLLCGATPPATARFFKVRLVGGESSVNVAGTAYWDGLAYSPLLCQSYSSISATALSEQSTTSATFVDAGSFTVTPRIGGLPMNLIFVAQRRQSNSDEMSQRFRVGSNYSSELTTSSAASVDGTFSIIIPSGSGTAITVTQQLKSSTGSASAYGGKASTSDIVNPIITI